MGKNKFMKIYFSAMSIVFLAMSIFARTQESSAILLIAVPICFGIGCVIELLEKLLEWAKNLNFKVDLKMTPNEEANTSPQP
jgi:hypothetical protein